MAKLYIIAGEASGDLHGSNFIRALKKQAPETECRAWGGDLMQEAGATLVKHYRNLAFMGFWEVLKNLRTILRNLSFCKQDILRFQPDALVLVDYPGFNLRMARWAKQQHIKVIYYISPQIWAWHTSRVHAIKRDVDEMMVILPFEQDFYRKYGMEVTYVGHPLLDAIQASQTKRAPDAPKNIVLLPGSRRQEVKKILPAMLSVVADFPDYQFIVAGSTALPSEVYLDYLKAFPQVQLVQGKTYDLLRQADAALVKSGTSTLETAILNTPQVVCYKGNWLSYQIARRLVDISYISLVNLIVNRPLVRELIQSELTRDKIRAALHEILQPEKAAEIREGYAELRHLLGEGGASEKAARKTLEMINVQ